MPTARATATTTKPTQPHGITLPTTLRVRYAPTVAGEHNCKHLRDSLTPQPLQYLGSTLEAVFHFNFGSVDVRFWPQKALGPGALSAVAKGLEQRCSWDRELRKSPDQIGDLLRATFLGAAASGLNTCSLTSYGFSSCKRGPASSAKMLKRVSSQTSDIAISLRCCAENCRHMFSSGFVIEVAELPTHNLGCQRCCQL